MADAHVYIRSKEYHWVPARVVEHISEDQVAVLVPQFASEGEILSNDLGCNNNSNNNIHIKYNRIVVNPNDYPNRVIPLQNVDNRTSGALMLVSDMVDLPFLHEAAILYNLKARHIQGKPYTRTGDIMIAVNPYQWFHHLYTRKCRLEYSRRLVWECHVNTKTSVIAGGDKHRSAASTLVPQVPPPLEPHVYEISALAFKGLAMYGRDQSILVSGESGAGKTETVKICLNHIAMVQAGPKGYVEFNDNTSNLDDRYRSRTGKSNNPTSTPDGSAMPTTATTTPANQTITIVQRVVDSNPLLEAFGNAKTRRNDNSSRFGKYIQLQFRTSQPKQPSFFLSTATATHSAAVPPCHLVGSTCQVYLLEKSRVVRHDVTASERNFHIFYQLLAAPDKIKVHFWKSLAGKTTESFAIVATADGQHQLNNRNCTETTVEGKTDAEHFKQTLRSLAMVGIEGEKLIMLMQAIIIVLQLGNIRFDGDEDTSFVTTSAELEELSELIGVSTDRLVKAFTTRKVRARRETVLSTLNPETAQDSVHALAKAIYEKAFLWLVEQINLATQATSCGETGSHGKLGIIGLLDIFGFECFETNGFEQLCINYANEKLQQKFNQDIFRQVQAEYEYEGLALEDIRYDDNLDVLDLMECRFGVVAMLDEECVRPQGNDKEFVYKTIQSNTDSVALLVEKRFDPYEFGIRHYAGDVVYRAVDFVAKNNDTLVTDLQRCARRSTNPIVASVYESQRHLTGKTVPSRKITSNLVAPTLWKKYKSGLRHLMSELKTTNSRYICCIKPNEFKQPLTMQHGPTLDQLRSAGVISAVTISRSAFPNRLDHATVLERFRLLKREKLPEDCDLSAQVAILLTPALQHLETQSNGRSIPAFSIGRTRTYFRAGALESLESDRIKRFEPAAVILEKIARGFLVRKRKHNAYIVERKAAVTIQARVRTMHAKAHWNRVKAEIEQERVLKMEMARRNDAATIINTYVRGKLSRIRFVRERQYHRQIAELQDEVDRLERLLAEIEVRKKRAVQDTEHRVRAATDFFRQKKSSSMLPGANGNGGLLLERVQQLEDMRKDNKNLRNTIKLCEIRYKRLREEHRQQVCENDRLGKEFSRRNEEAKKANDENEKSMDHQEVWKEQLEAMREELNRKQKQFHQVSDNRVEYQKALASILKLLRTQCKDEQVVEDAIFIAFEVEGEARSQQAQFDARMAQIENRTRARTSVTAADSLNDEQQNNDAIADATTVRM